MVNNGNAKLIKNRYNINERIQKSLPKNNNNYINYKKELLNKNIILPNLYGNNHSSRNNNNSSHKKIINLNLNKKNKSFGSYKIINSESGILINNLNNIKIIDGNNINAMNKNNNNIGLKKKNLINQINNDIDKIISKPKIINYNINKYNSPINEKDFLKKLYQRKKRMIYLGKI